MASQHGGFAAVTYVSEILVNKTLQTYLNNFLNGLSASIERSLPVVVDGAPLVLRASAEAALISVRAQLRKNPGNLVFLTFRFYATAQLDVFPRVNRMVTVPSSVPPVATHNPEIVIDATVSAALVAHAVGEQFHFGVNLTASSIHSLKVSMLSPGGLPNEYRSDVINMLESPQTIQTLNAVLRPIAAHHLRATPATVPSVYSFFLMKPVQPLEVWANARIEVGELVWWVLDGRLAVAVNVTGFTRGTIANVDTNLNMFSDMVSYSNLDFLETFLALKVLPQMMYAFVRYDVRIDSMVSFRFTHKHIGHEFINNIEVEFYVSYWTHSGVDHALRGTTRVSDILVKAPCALSLSNGQVRVKVGMIEADLPAWLDAFIFGLSLAVPPVTLLLPSALKSVLHNALVDVSNQINKKMAHSDGLQLRARFNLPGTPGPTYQFEPTGFVLACRADQRYAMLSANFDVVSQPELRVGLNDEAAVTVQPRISRQEVRRRGGLPAKMVAKLFLPPGLVQTKDPTLRVKFETYLNDKLVPRFSRDLRLFSGFPFTIDGTPMKPDVLVIDTSQFVNPAKLDQEVRIFCRFYRSMGGSTEELYNGSLYILSVDTRPDEIKPFVQWAHWVTYWNGYRRVTTQRRSKIHKVPGMGGCRFSNQFLLHGMTSKKFGSLRRFTDLPFEMIEIGANRDKVCPYCFFGGPDKPSIPTESKYDLTGAGGRRLTP